MPNKPEIALSIIVPCYKVEKYLPKCLDSLMGQTLPNIEAICINDGFPGSLHRHPSRLRVTLPREGRRHRQAKRRGLEGPLGRYRRRAR